MSVELTTTRQVVHALGGPDLRTAVQFVADLTGRKYTAALQWPYADKFPSNTYKVMTGALAEIGKSAPDSLWGMTGTPEQSSPNEQAAAQ